MFCWTVDHTYPAAYWPAKRLPTGAGWKRKLANQGRGAYRLSLFWCHSSAYLQLSCNTYVNNMSVRPVKVRCFFFTLECISSSNIHVHVGILRRYSLLINNLSTVSDLTNQTMIPESGIMDGRHQNRSVYRAPAVFSNSGHAQLASLIYFLFHSALLGSLFTS